MRIQVLTAASMKFRVFWDVVRVVTLKLTDVSDVRSASIIRAIIALMMVAVSTSETSVKFNVITRRYSQKTLNEIIFVYSENHTEPINTFFLQSTELLSVKADGTYSYHNFLKG
jgi:hypothetical protein